MDGEKGKATEHSQEIHLAKDVSGSECSVHLSYSKKINSRDSNHRMKENFPHRNRIGVAHEHRTAAF